MKNKKLIEQLKQTFDRTEHGLSGELTENYFAAPNELKFLLYVNDLPAYVIDNISLTQSVSWKSNTLRMELIKPMILKVAQELTDFNNMGGYKTLNLEINKINLNGSIIYKQKFKNCYVAAYDNSSIDEHITFIFETLKVE